MDREVVEGLHFGVRRVEGAPLVVFVHGVMDRGATFLGVTRRLQQTSWIIYDRRGYGRSVTSVAPSFSDHVGDLVDLIDREATTRRVALVGHSLGGTIALAAASSRPQSVEWLFVHEPPLPWLDWWPIRDESGRRIEDEGPESAVSSVLQRLIGADGWNALSPTMRARHISKGPALVAELVSARNGCPFDPAALTMPCGLSRGSLSEGYRERAQEWLLSAIPTASRIVIPGAGHNVQKTHPDLLVRFVEHPARSVDRRSIS